MDNKNAIEAAATSSSTAQNQGNAPEATPAPAAPTETPTTTTSAPSEQKFEDGGKISNEKIQWVAIGIFAVTITALVYKAMYYRKAITLLGTDNNKANKKLQELEKNVRALRGEKYERLD